VSGYSRHGHCCFPSYARHSFRYTVAMAIWDMTTENGARVVDRDGMRQYGGLPEGAWHYLTTHAEDDDEVRVFYVDSQRPTVLTGGAWRRVLAWINRPRPH
jgi:hypothetical protein